MRHSSRHCFCAYATIPSWLRIYGRIMWWQRKWHVNTIHHPRAFKGNRKRIDFCILTKLMSDKEKTFVVLRNVFWTSLSKHAFEPILDWFQNRKWNTWRCIVLFARIRYYLYHFSHSFQFGPLAKFNRSTVNISQMFKDVVMPREWRWVENCAKKHFPFMKSQCLSL